MTVFFPRLLGCALLAFALYAATACSSCRPDRAAEAPAAAPPPPAGAEPAAADALRITWLGTAGVYVTDGTEAILIDPFVSRYGMLRVGAGLPLESDAEGVRAWVERLGVPAGTPVLVSHSHYDHALDAPAFARAIGGRLVGSGDTAYIGIGAGLPAESMLRVTPGRANDFGRFRVTFRESCHGPHLAGIEIFAGSIDAPLAQPAAASAYRKGHVYSILIEHPRGRVLHHASACVLPDTTAGVQADTVLLGPYGRSSTQDLIRDVVDAVGAKRVLVIHWDDFFAPLDAASTEAPATVFGVGLGELQATLARERPGLEVVVPAIGSAWTLP